MKILYLSPIRSWLRHLGLTKLLVLPRTIKSQLRNAEYKRKQPEKVEVKVGEYTANLLVADIIEYSRVLSFQEDYRIIETLLNRVISGDYYWDIGANIGLYSVLLAKAVGESGRVFAFEPEERAGNRLQQNVAANNLSNVRIFPIALGRDRARLKLSVSQHASSGTHSLVIPENEVSTITTVDVDVIPGDELRKQEQIDVPTAIKVDVEGAEEEVLAGLNETLRHPNCKTVVCEIHFSVLESRGMPEAPARIERYLQECGFTRTFWLDYSHLVAYK